jgi:hypothetical protein
VKGIKLSFLIFTTQSKGDGRIGSKPASPFWLVSPLIPKAVKPPLLLHSVQGIVINRSRSPLDRGFELAIDFDVSSPLEHSHRLSLECRRARFSN